MSKPETLFKLKSKPTKDLEKIFSNEEARALWCIYRSYHIISDVGLDFLNEVCNDIVEKKRKFTNKSEAKKFLNTFEDNLSNIESSKGDHEWIDKAIPFLLGEKKIVIEVLKKNG